MKRPLEDTHEHEWILAFTGRLADKTEIRHLRCTCGEWKEEESAPKAPPQAPGLIMKGHSANKPKS